MAESTVPKSKEKTKLAWSTKDALDDALRREKVARYAAHRGVQLGLILAGALLVVGGVFLVAFRAPGNDPNACLHEHAGFIDVKPTCPEPVKLDRDGDVILAYPGASLEERGSGTRVRTGKVGFEARQRGDGNTLRVLVSHGVIEITGARFTVTQGEGRGDLKVEEGTVIYRDDDGTDVTVSAGGELVWPRPRPVVVALGDVPLVPAKSSAKASRRTRAAAATTVDEEEEAEEVDEAPQAAVMSMDEIINQVRTLRRQKRSQEAVALLLKESHRQDITDAQMARLSWEVGLFVQESGDKVGACRHWTNHARKYPDDAGRLSEILRICGASDS